MKDRYFGEKHKRKDLQETGLKIRRNSKFEPEQMGTVEREADQECIEQMND